MFCYSGMTPEQVDRLTKEYHIYMTRNGRIRYYDYTFFLDEYATFYANAIIMDSNTVWLE